MEKNNTIKTKKESIVVNKEKKGKTIICKVINNKQFEVTKVYRDVWNNYFDDFAAVFACIIVRNG